MKFMIKSKVKILCAVLVAFLAFMASDGVFAGQVNIRTKNLADRLSRVLDPRFFEGYKMVNEQSVVGSGQGIYGGDASIRRLYFTKSKTELDKLNEEGKLVDSSDSRIYINIEVYDTPAGALDSFTDKMASEEGFNLNSFNGKNFGDKTWSKEKPKTSLEDYKKELIVSEKPEKSIIDKEGKAEEKPEKKTEDKPEGKTDEKTEEKNTVKEDNGEKKTDAGDKTEADTKKLTPQEKRAKEEADKKAREEQEKQDKELAERLAKDPNNFYESTIIVVKQFCQIRITAVNYQKAPDVSILDEMAEKLADSI